MPEAFEPGGFLPGGLPRGGGAPLGGGITLLLRGGGPFGGPAEDMATDYGPVLESGKGCGVMGAGCAVAWYGEGVEMKGGGGLSESRVDGGACRSCVYSRIRIEGGGFFCIQPSYPLIKLHHHHQSLMGLPLPSLSHFSFLANCVPSALLL